MVNMWGMFCRMIGFYFFNVDAYGNKNELGEI